MLKRQIYLLGSQETLAFIIFTTLGDLTPRYLLLTGRRRVALDGLKLLAPSLRHPW